MLKEWNGEWTSLARLRFVRVRKEGGKGGGDGDGGDEGVVVVKSRFPPRGES